MQLSIKSNRNWKASSELEPVAQGPSSLATLLHTSEWENINYTTAAHVFQETKSVLLSHATVSHHPCPAGIAVPKPTSCCAADGAQPPETGDSCTPLLNPLAPTAPLHPQPLTPRWNKVIPSPRLCVSFAGWTEHFWLWRCANKPYCKYYSEFSDPCPPKGNHQLSAPASIAPDNFSIKISSKQFKWKKSR